MRQVVGLELRLSQLTSQTPEYTDGKLVPVTLQQLEVSQQPCHICHICIQHMYLQLRYIVYNNITVLSVIEQIQLARYFIV